MIGYIKSHLQAFHFWVMLAGGSLGAALQLGWIPSTGAWHQAAIVGMAVLFLLGYQLAVNYLPPAVRSALQGALQRDDAGPIRIGSGGFAVVELILALSALAVFLAVFVVVVIKAAH